jgi:hypothetical protein
VRRRASSGDQRAHLEAGPLGCAFEASVVELGSRDEERVRCREERAVSTEASGLQCEARRASRQAVLR